MGFSDVLRLTKGENTGKRDHKRMPVCRRDSQSVTFPQLVDNNNSRKR